MPEITSSVFEDDCSSFPPVEVWHRKGVNDIKAWQATLERREGSFSHDWVVLYEWARISPVGALVAVTSWPWRELELELELVKRENVASSYWKAEVKADLNLPRNVERIFLMLAAKWRAETAHISSVTRLVLHPSYQSIIGMGPDVVPLLLRELQKTPEHWFWALSSITRENPVRDEDAGDVEKMAQAWIHWGKARGYIVY